MTTLALALAVAAPARAQLPSGFTAKDIGDPGAVGSTRVENGVWTIQGSGADIWDSADSFHFAYTEVKGDGSISARILGTDGGDPSWVKAGLMIRENDTPGARNVMLEMTTGNGIEWQWRQEADEPSANQGGNLAPREFPTFMRVQRAGNDFSGFVSQDGTLWRAITNTRTIPMPETALFGLAVTSHSDGEITTARFDTVAVRPGFISVGGINSCGGDRAVLLTWRPLARAVGYHVYRGPAEVTADGLARLTSEPIPNASFADSSEGLTNGTPVSYAVSPLFRADDGSLTEGPLAVVQATPVAVPAGFSGCSIGARIGVASFDPATGELTLRAASGDTWGAADSLYFVGQPVEGDVQITARMLGRPAHTHDWAKSGVMIRESLEPGARNVIIGLSGANGLWQQWRPRTNGPSEWPGAPTIDNDTVRPPVVVRLTRRGNTITPEYSTDNGQTFQEGDEVYTFAENLPRTVYVGVSLSAINTTTPSEVKFSNIEIKKL